MCVCMCARAWRAWRACICVHACVSNPKYLSDMAKYLFSDVQALLHNLLSYYKLA